jgi:endonuclease YncB( thermonuclease family)
MKVRVSVVPIGFAVAIIACHCLFAGDFIGRAIGISDGDTISVMHEGSTEKIRLYGIDAPEKGQAFGNRAKQFVTALAYGKEVKVEAKGQDRYGRTVANVIIRDGKITSAIRYRRSVFLVLV